MQLPKQAQVIIIRSSVALFGKDMENKGFPAISISSRISNISNCYKNYGSAKSFIAGVIEKRGLD